MALSPTEPPGDDDDGTDSLVDPEPDWDLANDLHRELEWDDAGNPD